MTCNPVPGIALVVVAVAVFLATGVIGPPVAIGYSPGTRGYSSMKAPSKSIVEEMVGLMPLTDSSIVTSSTPLPYTA